MHSLRLLSNCSMLYRQLSILLEKNVKQNFSSFYSSKEATETNINEAEQFKAAVLHPKKSNLNVETLVLPNTIADGMVSPCNLTMLILFNFINLNLNEFIFG